MLRFMLVSLVALWSFAASAIHIQLPEQVGEEWSHSVKLGTIVAAITADPYVDLHFSSPGGYVHSALEVLGWMDLGRANGITYRCHVEGLAASAAFLVLTACDERFATRGSQFLVHEMWFTINPSDIYPKVSEELALYAELSYKLQEQINAYQADRMRIRWEQIAKWYREEYLFSTYELVTLAPGFINVATK